jgi:hypothetical protein
MEQIAAVWELHRMGCILKSQIEAYLCGSEYHPERARRVLELAEIAKPGIIQELINSPQP